MSAPNQPNQPPEQITVYNRPQTDYTNSHRSKRKFNLGSQKPAQPELPEYTSEPERDGFFRATLKQAFQDAIKNVVDPAVRGFLWNTLTSIGGSLIWGKEAQRLYSPGRTPYREISTGATPASPPYRPALPPGGRSMTEEARMNQEYLRCSKPTQEAVYAVMSKLFRTLRQNGKVTLANYYEAFGERYDFNDEAFGWTSLPQDAVYAQYFEGGYHVRMPKLEVLDSEIRR